MHEAEAGIIDGVQRLASDWVVRTAVRVADGNEPDVGASAVRVGEAARDRVVNELRALFALPPEAQRSTPLEIVRTLRHEVTAVLAAAGVPPVVRDPFEERAFPDDVYGIVPRSLADLGDDDLGPLLLAWGMGKTLALRADRE